MSELKGWQPIASIPDDGSVVLLCTDKGDVAVGCWGATGKRGCGVADETYPWLFFDPDSGGLNAYMEHKPTHWMPLPPPPKD